MSEKQSKTLQSILDLDVDVLDLDESEVVSTTAASSGSSSCGSLCGSSSCCA